MPRSATIERNTRETQIKLSLALDGQPAGASLATGLPFFEHVLDAMARHGHLGLAIQAHGDLEIDPHHTMEDTGLVFGAALKEALGSKGGINRFGSAVIPLDEALARVVIDLSGRPHLSWRCTFPESSVGGISCRLFHEFFQAAANTAGMTLHIDLLHGEEAHHCVEAIFKAFGRALRQAVNPDPLLAAGDTPSTKGHLD